MPTLCCLVRQALALLVFLGAVNAQNYTVYTVAGGGLPNQVLATSVGVQSPTSVAKDGNGNLYVGFGAGVYKVDTAGVLSVLATTAYIVDYLAADTAGNVYLSGIIITINGGGFGLGYTCSVQKISNGIVTDFVGHGTCDSTSPLGHVTGLATAVNGDVYIADTTTVRKVSNGVLTTIAGNGTSASSGDGGPATSASVQPKGIAVDQNTNVYITENHSASGYFIRAVTNGTINRFAGGGTNANDGASASAALLNSLSGYMVAGAPGAVYFSDATRVRAILNGTLTTIAGSSPCTSPPFPSPVCDGGPALNASLSGPSGIALDGNGTLYIADAGHQRVRTVSNGTINTVVGNGTSSLGDGISATDESLAFPSGVATDNSGDVFILDGNNSLRKIADGVISRLTTSSSGFTGEALAIDGSGNFYSADLGQSKVFKYSKNGVVTTFAGNGSVTASGDGGLATNAGIPDPNSVAVDSLGNVYIASSSVIREVSASSGNITTIAGVSGKFGSSGDNGPATQALFSSQLWVAVDSSFNVYVGDSGNSRVRKISGGIVNTIAAGLLFPAAIAADNSGNVYVTDGSVITKISNGVASVIGGNGIAGFSGDGVPALDAQLCPYSLTVDSSGRVYFTDSNCGNAIVRVLIPPPGGTTSPPNLLSLSPSSAPVGAASMNLVVNGSGFASGNVVLWNGSPLPTTFVSGTTLKAAVGSALFAAAGTALVSVGDSNSLAFRVTGPAINSLSPSSVVPGSQNFTLTVNGFNFVTGSTVIFNGTSLTTTFKSSTQLTAIVPSSLLTSQVTVLVYVLNLNAASNEFVFPIFGGGPSPVTCVANGGVPPLLRFEGEAELLGDLLLNCINSQGVPVPADVTVFGNVPLTSRILNSATNASEALLLIDDPPVSQQVLNTNVFQGTVDGPDVVFKAVPIPSGGTQSLRIVNLRADAHAFGLGTASAQPDFVGVTLSGISVTNGVQTLGFVQPTEFKTQTVSSANDQRSVRLSYTERFATAFKTRLDPSGSQSTPGKVYNTESGFVNATLVPGAGLADSGTRLFLQISAVPTGVNAYVSVFPEGSTNARLVSTDSNGAGPISPIAGSSLFGGTYSQVPISNGLGIAVWEVLTANPSALETLTFDLVLTGVTQSGLGPVVLKGTLGPLSPINTSSASAPLPRFAPDSITSFIDLTLLSASSGAGAGLSSRYVSSGKGATATTSTTPPSVQAGKNLSFSFNLLNNGPGPATQVTVTSNLPPGISPVSGSCTLVGGTCTMTTNADSSTTVTGQFTGALQQGQAPAFSFMATPTQVSSQLMSVISELSSSQTDSNPDDNTIVTSFTVGSSAPPPVTVQFASSPVNIPILNGSNQPLTSLSVSQYGALPNFSVVSPQAGPNGTQYSFSSWSDGSTSAVRNGVPVPIGGGTFRAFFDTQYPVKLTTSGRGSVTFMPSAGSNYYSLGASVQIQATAAPGYSFAGFSGDVTSTTNPLAVVMPGKALNIIATFAPGGPTNAGIFRNGFLWVLDVDGNQKTNIPPDLVYAFGGIPGDIPIAGDWTGDGHTKIGIYRPGNGLFILDSNGNGILDAGDAVFNLHIGKSPGDIPVVGDWNGDGRSKVGCFRQGFLWILDTNGDHVFEQGLDSVYAFGG
ncbi:MAG TPA: SBBP repeat-containing protein, partial [Bryobacteraceae bacterium]|nr:SBBP repeat-containing protein [Bryobacteraceae bacterium]